MERRTPLQRVRDFLWFARRWKLLRRCPKGGRLGVVRPLLARAQAREAPVMVRKLLLAVLDRLNHPLRPWLTSCISGSLCEWTSYQQARPEIESVHASPVEVIEQEIVRLYEREKLAWALFKPVAMTGLAILITVVEPFTLWFMLIEGLVWLAAAVDWWQFAMDRIGPGWRAKWRGRNG